MHKNHRFNLLQRVLYFPQRNWFLHSVWLETAKKVNALGLGYKVGFKPVELQSQKIFIMDFWKVPLPSLGAILHYG